MKTKILFWLGIVIGLVILVTNPLLSMAQASFPVDGVVLRTANLRAGPGTTYAVAGSLSQGNTLKVVGCNAACDWYQLENGKWIAAFLVKLVATPPVAGNSPITVVGWNTELNGADVKVIAERLAAFQEVDLWGLAEINRPTDAPILEAGAEVGENAEYSSILSVSGGGDRLLAIYDTTRFDLLDAFELDAINTTGNARAPLVLQLRDKGSGEEILFMVNHLYRTRNDERYKQARLLNEWAVAQTLPVIAVGDYNFDWDITDGDHDTGYDLLTNQGEFRWVKPETLVTTQCSGWPCQFNSVLDFVFVAGPAQAWRAESEIVVVEGDFPDNNSTSDHRPVLARFWPVAETSSSPIAAPPTVTPVVAAPSVPTQAPQPATATAVPVAPTATSMPVVVATLAPAQPAEASGITNVVIQTVYFDGQVARVESDEYAVIANIGTAPIDLGGWRLNAGDAGQDFRFPGFTLAPGQAIRVYTNESHPESGGFSFGSGQAIWNNKGDCGYLFDAGGKQVAEWCYS